MTPNFTSKFFAGNRHRLNKLNTHSTPIVITAAALLQRTADEAFPFRQDSNFWYLTGIDEPEIILVLDEGKEYLIVPERHYIRNIFDGQISTKELTTRSGIEEVLDAKEGWERLGARLKLLKTVATLVPPPAYIEGYEFYTNPSRAALVTKMREYSPNLDLIDVREYFAKLRVVKQAVELKAIKYAVNLTVSALKELQHNLSQFSYEYEVEAFLYQAYRQEGARLGYDPIIASGLNACTLHYNANDAPIDKKALLLIDTGAEHHGYSADISRTYAFQTASKRQKQVYKAVRDVQDYALDNLRPGITIKENEKLVEQYMGEKLQELGLIKSTEKDAVRRYFPHATSHSLGLDLHDLADYEQPLAPGTVLTVEPGIYIPEEGIGIRIEDDIIITKNGAEVITSDLPRSLA